MRVEPAKLFPCRFRVLCLGYGWMYFRQTERVKLLHTVCLLAFGVGQDIYEYIIQTEFYKLLLRMNAKFFYIF
jgi:hypothetical protein